MVMIAIAVLLFPRRCRDRANGFLEPRYRADALVCFSLQAHVGRLAPGMTTLLIWILVSLAISDKSRLNTLLLSARSKLSLEGDGYRMPRHPHILPLHDSGQANVFLYYVMPFVESESLRQQLNRVKQPAVEESIEIAGGVEAAYRLARGDAARLSPLEVSCSGFYSSSR